MLHADHCSSLSSRRLVVRALAGTAAALTLLAACGSPEPEPVDTPSRASSKSATPTPSKSASPSPSPKPSAGSLEEQLEAATVAFYDAVTEAYEKLDPAPIQAVIVPGSQAGGFYLNRVAEMKSQNHRYEDLPEFTVTNFKLEPQDAESQFESVTFTLTSNGSREVDAKGKTVDENKAGSANGRIEFQRKEGKWLVLSQRFEE